MGWSNQVIQASEVIIAGAPDALLVYAGTPGPGTLIASITSAGGTDPYGNAETAGVASYSGAGWVSLDGAQVNFSNGGFISQNPNDMVFGGVPLDFLEPIASVLNTVEPGTTATPETWHPLGAVTGTGCTVLQARYQQTADGKHTEIDVWLEAGSGGSTAGTYTFANALGADWQFQGNGLRVCPLPFNAPIITATQDSVIVVDGAGTASPGRVRITIPAVAANVFFTGTCMIPLT
jgi:hypothetical protein